MRLGFLSLGPVQEAADDVQLLYGRLIGPNHPVIDIQNIFRPDKCYRSAAVVYRLLHFPWSILLLNRNACHALKEFFNPSYWMTLAHLQPPKAHDIRWMPCIAPCAGVYHVYLPTPVQLKQKVIKQKVLGIIGCLHLVLPVLGRISLGFRSGMWSGIPWVRLWLSWSN